MTYDELFAQIERRIEQGQLKTALENLMTIAAHSSTSEIIKAKVRYDIGVLFYKHIGNGEKARIHFKTVADLCAQMVSTADRRIQQLNVFALENLLLLSLSYEEFESLGDQIRTLSPSSETISMINGVREMKTKGSSWAEVMGFMGGHAFEQKDYPLVASIFQLMLAHRGGLRLSRKQWRGAVRTYGEAIRYILASHGDRIERERRVLSAGRRTSPTEVVFLGEDALPVLNEYLNDNSSDDEVMEIKKDIEEVIQHLNRMK